jgi:hypothetical protein
MDRGITVERDDRRAHLNRSSVRKTTEDGDEPDFYSVLCCLPDASAYLHIRAEPGNHHGLGRDGTRLVGRPLHYRPAEMLLVPKQRNPFAQSLQFMFALFSDV